MSSVYIFEIIDRYLILSVNLAYNLTLFRLALYLQTQKKIYNTKTTILI